MVGAGVGAQHVTEWTVPGGAVAEVQAAGGGDAEGAGGGRRARPDTCRACSTAAGAGGGTHAGRHRTARGEGQLAA